MNVGKNTLRLPDVTGVAISASVTFQLGPDVGACLVYSTSAACTFVIEGRIAPDAPWVPIINSTAPTGAQDAQVQIVRMLPEVRMNQSVGAGTIKCWIQA